MAAYSFDEGAGSTVADASGNGNTGTINGAAWTTQAKFGRALSFNGTSDYVDLGNRASLRITGSMTWSAWVYATGNPVDDGQIIAKSANGGGGTGWQFKTSPDTGPHTFGVGVSPDGTAITQRYSTTNRTLNTWYHVAGVYDAAARDAAHLRQRRPRRRCAVRHGSGVAVRPDPERHHRTAVAAASTSRARSTRCGCTTAP